VNIHHEIVSFNPASGSIAVRYYTDEFTSGYTFNIDLPLEDGAYPSQEKINELIDHFAPVGQLERTEALLSASVPSHLAPLTVTPSSGVSSDQIARIQRDEKLYACDWTQLPDATLSADEKLAWSEYRQALRDVPAQQGFPDNIVWPISPSQEPR
jgi:hypothetical protein